MAWTAPTNVATGDVLTATRYNNEVVGNTYAGGPIYTTEALRNAAIPTPFVGQQAYITASTQTAPTGAVTYIPALIKTVYDGTQWCCITPVSAWTTTGGTLVGPAGPTAVLTAGGTNPTVTIASGTRVLVSISAYVTCTVAATLTMEVVTTGAAAGSGYNVKTQVSPGDATYSRTMSATFVMTVTGGTANLYTPQYSVNTGTGTFADRRIVVQAIA